MTRRVVAIIAAGFFTVFIAYAIRYAYGMLLPEMLLDIGISKTGAGTIFSFYFIIYTICAPILGAASDRYDYRTILTLFTAIAAAGTILMGFADGFGLACAGFSVVALGHTACWAPVVAVVQKWVPNERRGLALSIVAAGVSLGILLWGLVLPLIVAQADWRAGWYALGVFSLAVALLNWLLVRNPTDSQTIAAAQLNRKSSLWTSYAPLLRDKAFWIVGSSYLLAGFNVLVPFTYLPVYAREQLHLPYATATRFIVIIAFSAMIGQLVLGPLSDIFSRIRLMIGCGLIIGTACLGMILSSGPWGLYATTAFYGLGYGAIWPIYAAVASDFFSNRQTGTVVGLWTALLGLGSIISPVVCGWTIDRTGSYSWTFLLGLVSGLLSAVIPWALLKAERPLVQSAA